MKKVSISILLILPFILIYFISLLGKVVSKFSHIAVEYVALYVDNVRQEENKRFTYDLDEVGSQPMELDIRVMPEFANDRTYNVANTNENVSKVEVADDGKAYLTLLDEGVSYYTVSSNEISSIQYHFSVYVEKGELKEIKVYNTNGPRNTYIDSVSLAVGKQKTLSCDFVPVTTKQEYKNITWKSSDEFIVSVNGGVLTGVGVGEAVITVSSFNKLGPVTKEIAVSVTAESTEQAYFNWYSVDALSITKYTVSNTFNFKEGGADGKGKLVLTNGLTYNDVILKVDSSAADHIDLNQLSNFVFAPKDNCVVRIGLALKSQPLYELDHITMMYWLK